MVPGWMNVYTDTAISIHPSSCYPGKYTDKESEYDRFGDTTLRFVVQLGTLSSSLAFIKETLSWEVLLRAKVPRTW